MNGAGRAAGRGSPGTAMRYADRVPVPRSPTMPTPRDAAVLVPVYRDGDGRARVVLIRRTNAGPHAGETALPGGKPIDRDERPATTAVRETAEELGIAEADIELLEALPTVHTRSTGFRIQPFLGRLRPPPRWSPQASEVAAVLPLAVAELLAPAARRRERVVADPRRAPIEVPCLRVGPVRIWGASYRILEPVLGRLAAAARP